MSRLWTRTENQMSATPSESRCDGGRVGGVEGFGVDPREVGAFLGGEGGGVVVGGHEGLDQIGKAGLIGGSEPGLGVEDEGLEAGVHGGSVAQEGWTGKWGRRKPCDRAGDWV